VIFAVALGNFAPYASWNALAALRAWSLSSADQISARAFFAPSGIAAYATDLDGGLVAFALADWLWTVDVASGRVRRLPAEGPVVDPRPDPAGRRIAYLSGGALRMIEADGTGDRTIAAPDGPNVTFGVAEHTGEASLGGSRGYWWAPDGALLLVARVDSTAVELWHIADPAEPGKAPRAVRYAAVGRANAEVTLWIAGLDGSRTEARWDRGAFEYVPGAGWDAHGPYAVVQSRNQRTVRFLGIEPVGGQTRVLSEQRDECWVQLIPGLPARTGSGALIAHADLQGTRHLNVNGVTVTPPGLQVRAVLGVDGDQVLFTASEEPAETHLWSYRAGEGIRRLSAEPGVHSGVRHGGTLVHVARCGDQPGGRVTVLREGKPAVPIASLVELPVLDVHATRLVLGPRELRAGLYLPSWHRPNSEQLPVLVDPYGGAGLQRVTAEPEWRSLLSQWFAEQGFAVLVVDGSGTPGRGPDWEREVHGDLFGPVLEDQVTALHEAARLHPELDLTRVGIRGWSFGGSLAALAVLRRPDVFHAAVAGAGSHRPAALQRVLARAVPRSSRRVPATVRGVLAGAGGAETDPAAAVDARSRGRQRPFGEHASPVQGVAGRRPPARGAAPTRCGSPGDRRADHREPAVASSALSAKAPQCPPAR